MNMCIEISCCPVCDVINLGIKINFCIKPFFLHDEQFGANNVNISRIKRALSIK